MSLSDLVIPAWLKDFLGILLGLVLIVGLIGLPIYFYGQQQFKRGEQAGAEPYIKQANTDLINANDLIAKLQRDARNTELAHAKRLADIDETYQEKQANDKAQSDLVIANLRAGITKLQFKSPATVASTCQASTSGTSQAGPSPSISDAETTSQLPDSIAADLYTLAADANDVAEQLDACQQVIIEDRRICGVKP